MKHLLNIKVFLGILLWSLALPLQAQHTNFEASVKAAYLSRFLSFIGYEGSPDVIAYNEKAALNICVYKDAEIYRALEDLEQATKNRSSNVAYREVSSFNNVSDCSLIFIGRAAASGLTEILTELRLKPIVTVSDISGFAQRGGMIELIKEGPHVRFVINRASSKLAGIKFGSQLLSLAREVIEE